MPCALGHPICPSGSSTEPNFTPLLNCYPTSEQNINCMPLLLLTSWDITETQWQLVISIFNSWEVFCMAVLLAGVGFNMLSSFLWKADSPRGPCSRFLCTWMDQGLRCAIRSKWSHLHPGRCSALQHGFFQFSHNSPLSMVLVASAVHPPSSAPFRPSQGLCLQTGGFFLSGSVFFQHHLNITPLTPDLIFQPL